MKECPGLTRIDNKPISLRHALELVIRLQDKYLMKKRIDFHNKFIEYQKQFRQTLDKMLETKTRINVLLILMLHRCPVYL